MSQRFAEDQIERLTRGLMTREEVAGLGDDNVRAILSETGRTQYAHVPDAIMVGGDEADGKKVVRYVMITESALPPFDRVILMDGIQLGEFKRRGAPLLFAHGDAPFPLGTIGNIENGHGGRGRKKRNNLQGDADFLAAEHWEFAALTFEMVQAGILRGFSIGFDIVAEREPTKDEVQQFGIKSQFGTIATKINLVEGSVVPLGRDPDAQVIGRVRNQYGRRLDALCAEGVCTRDGADEFLSTVIGASPSGTSYVPAPPGGWANGIYNGRAQEGGVMCEKCGTETCQGGCDDRQLEAVASEQLAAAMQRIDVLSGELAAVGEGVAQLEGVVNAQRAELRRLRARQSAFEGEVREVSLQRPLALPNYHPPGPLDETPEEIDLDGMSAEEANDVLAGALLASVETKEA